MTTLAGSTSPWRADGEEPEDFEILHTVAPAATLRVVLFPSSWGQSPANATADMLAGLRLAVSHTDVVSISWSLGEHYFTKAQVAAMHSLLLGAAAHHVTVIGSSGDGGWFPTPRGWGGQVKEVSLPASDPLVLGVGGTNLIANSSTGVYGSETAWPESGGGFSHLYARPAYQDGVPESQRRGACPTWPVTPMRPTTLRDRILWASPAPAPPRRCGVDSWRWPTSTPTTTLASSTPPSTGSPSSSYRKAFHDVTSGSNGYLAARGWDPVTGWGSPNAQVLIPLLARFTSPSKT